MKRIFENPVIGDRVHFLKYAQEPGEATTIVEVDLKPGGGNGLHYHRSYDEHFECLEGQLSIEVDKQIIVLQPGEKATAPRMSIHRFFNTSQQGARFRTTISPGHKGFEHSLKIAYGLASDGHFSRRGIPKKFWHMAALVTVSDTNLPGLFRLLEPVLHRIARRAFADGRYERELVPYTQQ